MTENYMETLDKKENGKKKKEGEREREKIKKKKIDLIKMFQRI